MFCDWVLIQWLVFRLLDEGKRGIGMTQMIMAPVVGPVAVALTWYLRGAGARADLLPDHEA